MALQLRSSSVLLSKKKKEAWFQFIKRRKWRSRSAGGQRDDENIHVRMLNAHRLKEVFGILKVKVTYRCTTVVHGWSLVTYINTVLATVFKMARETWRLVQTGTCFDVFLKDWFQVYVNASLTWKIDEYSCFFQVFIQIIQSSRHTVCPNEFWV